MMLLMMLLTTVTAWAAENTTFPLTNGQTWTNTTTNTQYTVSGEAGNWTLTVSVADPSVNDGKGYIANQAFMDKNIGDVKTIAIDAGITSIGEKALRTYPRNFTTVTFAENSQLTTIAKGAFESCENLTSINLGDCLMLESIGDGAFYNCTGLTTLDLSGCTLLTSIGEVAFAYCSNLTITILKGLTIGSSAFYNVKEVNQVDITLDGLTYNETDDCYDIGSLTELQAFLTYANDVGHTSQCKNLTFRLTDNIDMTEQTYTPIPMFIGTFNGNSKTITGLAGSNGLFECIEKGGSVTDLTLSGVSISSESSLVGAIAGTCVGVIERCHVTGSVSGQYGVGGIAGYLIMNSTTDTTNPHISGCTFSGTVTGTRQYVGGICGHGYRAIQNCTVSGSTIAGDHYVGGIMGGYVEGAPADYDISGCTVAGVTVAANYSYGLIMGYVHPNVSANIHDNEIYYSVEAGEGVTIAYQSGDKTTIGGKDYYKTGATLTLGHTDREGYVFGGYETTPADIIVNGTLTMPESNVTVNATWADPDDISVNAAGNEFTIYTAAGWNVFCDLLAANDGKTYFSGKTVKLGDDIEVTRMAGSSGHDFTGTFDGQGHTLTVDYGTEESPINEQYAAPFRYVDGATIQNLIVDGTIISDNYRAAGFIGETGETTSHITNCVSSSTISGGRYIGGFSIGGNVEIESCVFNGKINGSEKSGGFVGYSNSKLKITNCLFAPKEGSSISGGTFYFNGGGEITPENCYYTEALGTVQGEKGILLFDSGVPATANEDVISRCNGQQYDVKLQGRTLYKDGSWNTLCLPFTVSSFSFLDGFIFGGAEVRELDTDGKYNADYEKYDAEDASLNEADFPYQTGHLADGTMHIYFEQAGNIIAHWPYIIKWNRPDNYVPYDPANPTAWEWANPADRDIVNPVFTNVMVSYEEPREHTSWEDGSQFGNLTFVGTGNAPVDIYTEEKTNLYLGADNKLYYPWSEGMTEFYVGPFRAYFRLNNGLSCGDPDSGVRGFNINYGGEQTGILSTTNLTNFTNNADWYSLDGRKLQGKPTKKGLYINNGKAVVIK